MALSPVRASLLAFAAPLEASLAGKLLHRRAYNKGGLLQ